MSGEEQRAHERAAVKYPAKIRIDDREIDGTVENLGVLGALIATVELEPHFDIGQRIELTITMAGRDPVVAAGEVLRVDQEFSGGEIRRSFAVRFDAAVDV